jgi:hypothetical protein
MKAMISTRATPATSRGRLSRLAAAALSLAAAAVLGSAGCGSKMEEKECTRLKIESFDIVNKAQHCNTDTDCKGSTWPDCAKPLSETNAAEIKKRSDAYYAGQCEEKKLDCKDDTPIYCKQGLCTRKEKGSDSAAGTAP